MATLLSRSAPPDPVDWVATERWIEVRSQRLANKMARLIRNIVRDVYGEFIDSVEMMTVTASGDINIVDKIKPRWEMVIPDVMEDVEEMYLSGAISAFGIASTKFDIPEEIVRGWTDVVNKSAVAYMSGAENRLRGVGDTLWKDVRSRATEAVEQGLPRDQLAAQLRELSDKFSGYRADVIARTEINGAYMNGDYEADLALGEFGPVEKVWVARDDGRTRPWHLNADGQYVLFSEPFDVDGEPMMFPHDPGASAANVVNCRCHYEALYLGDERPDGTIVGEDEIVQAQEEADAVLAEEEMDALAEDETFVDSEFTMTREEADAWVEDSAYKGDLYHGTSAESANLIKEGGFRTSAEPYGEGVFFTPTLQNAIGYATPSVREVQAEAILRSGGEVLTTKIKVNRVASLEDWNGARQTITNEDVTAMATEMGGDALGAMGRLIRQRLQDSGFDAVDLGSGFGEFIVFNPRSIRIIAEESIVL